MPKKNRVMLVTCEWKDEFLNKDGESKEFVLVMGDSYHTFEYEFTDIFYSYMDKSYYKANLDRKGRFVGITLKINILYINYAYGDYVSYGGLKCCNVADYKDEVIEHNKNCDEKCRFIDELYFREYPEEKFLKLLNKMNIICDRREIQKEFENA